MKVVVFIGFLVSSAIAFAPSVSRQHGVATRTSSTQVNMFGGSGDMTPKEDDEEKLKQFEAAAKSMGMSVEEYQLGVNARIQFENKISTMRIKAGTSDVGVEVDGRSPPTHLVVTITDAGKESGKEALSASLASAFKAANEQAKAGRAEAQKDMMKFIQDSVKK